MCSSPNHKGSGCCRYLNNFTGGGAGIRTLGGLPPTHAFEACSLGHSDTPPRTRVPEPTPRPEIGSPGPAVRLASADPAAHRPAASRPHRTSRATAATADPANAARSKVTWLSRRINSTPNPVPTSTTGTSIATNRRLSG